MLFYFIQSFLKRIFTTAQVPNLTDLSHGEARISAVIETTIQVCKEVTGKVVVDNLSRCVKDDCVLHKPVVDNYSSKVRKI
jgi:hypothetical protein